MQSNVMDHKVVKNSKSVKIYDDIEDTIDTKKPIKRLTKAKIRQIMGMAVIGKPDDIFDALDDSGITRGRSVSSTAVNYYKKRDRSSSADAVNTEYSGEKRRKTQSITPGSTPGRVLRSGGKSTDTPALKKMDKSEKKKAMIYTPEDLEIQRQSDTSNTPQLADRISTRSTRSSPADPDIGLEEVKRYLYERPQACASVGSYNENNLSTGAAWTASYANNLSKRKAPIASAVNLKPMKKKKSLSAEGTFHSKTDVAVIEALRDRDAGIAKRNSKSPTGWRPKPSGRVRAIIDSTSGRVITSIDDGGDSDDESDVDDADDE